MILYLFGEPELVLRKAPAVDAFPTVALSSDKLYVHGGVGRSINASSANDLPFSSLDELAVVLEEL